jgi:hypothetical protein
VELSSLIIIDQSKYLIHTSERNFVLFVSSWFSFHKAKSARTGMEDAVRPFFRKPVSESLVTWIRYDRHQWRSLCPSFQKPSKA